MLKRSAVVIFLVTLAGGCGPSAGEKELAHFITKHVEKIEPLSKEANLSYWRAATTGASEEYKRYSELDLELRQVYSDSSAYAFLKKIRSSNQVSDPLLARQMDLLYFDFLENQIEPGLLKRIVDLSAAVEEKFSTYRATLRGAKVTSNEIDRILKTETDSRIRRQAWEASKQVGALVAGDIVELVKRRNQAARALGFDDYHELSTATREQKVEQLDAIFDQLYDLTGEPFAVLKAELDSILAGAYGIGVPELMPWHYHDPFFQETPLVYELDLDAYYKDADIAEIASRFYAGIGMPVEDILSASDLYEREGKNPHAFCTDIDREGDVRVLCNLQNTERWMETMLHELGHAVYDKYQDRDFPFLLRRYAHVFTTEAVAMFFGRLSRDAAWMQSMLDLSDEERGQIAEMSGKYARLKQLIFARWAMVMYYFEKALYKDPDADLNRLWWDLVEKYQGVTRPPERDEPDLAAKIHFTIAPCYYHNYLLGELLASQLHHHIVQELLKAPSPEGVSLAGESAVGGFFIKRIFEAGARWPWNEMIERATGEPLTAKYFVEQFVR